MKKIVLSFTVVSMLVACSNEPKPTTQEIKAVENQVAQDQLAMDSMEKVIQQQIDAISDDSLMDVNH